MQEQEEAAAHRATLLLATRVPQRALPQQGPARPSYVGAIALKSATTTGESA